MESADVKVMFGRRVRQLRVAKGISQEAFAHEIEIDRSYYGSIERGLRNVSLDHICLIAAGLGVEPAELLRFNALPASGGPKIPKTPRPSAPKGSRPRGSC